MKLFFNSIFLFGIFAYIGAGTVPIWKCLKNNELKINVQCFEKEKTNSCCSKDRSPSITVLKDACCELIDQPWFSSINNSFEESTEIVKITSLGFKLFEIPVDPNASLGLHREVNSSSKRGSPPLYKIHSSYIC